MSTQKAQDWLVALTKHSDIAIALFVVGIVFMMILPIPTLLVDTFITINMGTAVVLLMVAIYMESPLSFSTFPAVLLLTTLFRLALSITTTRLILLQADAGDIVYTFGNFVVAGNLVVGVVIFLIITLVQFIVITKGSERVAEVSARFSLDGLPGKQMSIDGDLRAGVINMYQAKSRRQVLDKEIQFYGAMDGAMKFVKGDAIAGLFIILVNILGGVSIGLLQKGMSIGDALQVYAILTIGDGLVAQIPALFIAITAGIIVTRVSTTDGDSNLGSDIAFQLMAQPTALIVGGALLFGFALIPGFPSTIFSVLSLVVIGVGVTLKATEARSKEDEQWALPAMEAAGRNQDLSAPDVTAEFSVSVPIMLEISKDISEFIYPEYLNSELSKLREELSLDLGVPFPGIHLNFSERLTPGSYIILHDEVPVAQGQVLNEHLFVRSNAEQLDKLSIPYQEKQVFLPDFPSLWVEQKYRPVLADAELIFLDIHQIFSFHLSFVLKKYAEEFIGIQETRYLLDQTDADFSDLVKEAQNIMPIQKISEVLKRLVSEGISIRNMRTILEAVVEWGQKEKDSAVITELIRSKLKRQISHKFSNEENTLFALIIDPNTEKTIRESIRQTPTGRFINIDPGTKRQFIENIKKNVAEMGDKVAKPILLTAMDIRHSVHQLIKSEILELAVLSYQELADDISVQTMAQINLSK